MRAAVLITLATGALAARPYINEPDTGIEDVLGDTPQGTLANITGLVGLPDFEWAARRYLPIENYTYYMNGAGGEWSARNNLEVYHRYNWRARQLVDITNIPATLPTTILGYNFSTPFFISPCARGVNGHPDAELNLVKGAAAGNIMYMPSAFSSKSAAEISAAKAKDQVLFQQLYLTANLTADTATLRRYEAAGVNLTKLTWDYYEQLKKVTKLPIAVKGVTSAETARQAIKHKVPAILVSNHGGRSFDGSPSSLEILLELNQKAPEVFKRTEVWADGGVRYGGDILKLLALGAKAVGVGRPYMFANIYGTEGVEKVTELLRRELIVDAGNLGLPSLKEIDSTYVNWTPNNWYS
ncbi:40S ribosomal protein S20 [Verticillium dahliae VDG1]|nr:40S ribosomal protein S20 [Verticillium dahliae VDG1]